MPAWLMDKFILDSSLAAKVFLCVYSGACVEWLTVCSTFSPWCYGDRHWVGPLTCSYIDDVSFDVVFDAM